MSKKKTSKRLETLFKGVQTEDLKPPRPDRKQPRQTRREPSLPLIPQPAAPTPALRREEAPPVSSAAGTMSLAFRTDEKSWATLRVEDENNPRVWAMEEQMLVKQVADQLSLALENARLFQDSRQRAAELTVLNELSRELSSEFEVAAIAETVYRHVSRLMDTTNFYLAVFDPARHQFSFPLLVDEGKRLRVEDRDIAQGLSAYVIRTKQPLFIPDNVSAKMQELGIQTLQIGNPNQATCWLGAPLLAGETVVGLITVQSTSAPNLYTAQHRDLLLAVASQAAIALENARLFKETQRRAREMSALAEVGQDVSASLDLQTVLERIAGHAKELLNGMSSAVYLPDADNRVFRAVAALGDNVDEIKNDPVQNGEGILGNIAKRGKGEIVNDASADRRALVIGGTTSLAYEHLMAVPVLSGERVSGVMTIWRMGRGQEFTGSELEFLTGLSRQAAIAIENARLFEATRHSQQRVERSEGELRSLFSAMNDVIIVYDRDGRYVRIAPTNPSRLFLPPDDLLGKKVSDVLPTETAQAIMLAIDTALTTNQTAKLEYTLEINQEVYWFDGSVSKLGEDQVFLVARDVTGRKYNELLQAAITQIAEAALTAPNLGELLKIIHENVGSLMPARNFYVSLYDERTDQMTFPYFADERAAPLPPQKPGRGLTSYVLRTGRPLLVTPEVFDDLEKSGEIAAGGTPRGVDWIGVPLRSGNKRLGVMAVQTYDPGLQLTEQDRDTLNLIAAQAAIAIERNRSQEELLKFKLGIDHSDDAVFMTDTTGLILYVNPGFEKVYGFKPSEALGQNPRIIQSGLLTKKDYEQFWGTLLSKNTVSGELTNKAKDGRLVPIAGTNSPILNEANEIIGFLAVHHDMTATKRAEEALKRQNEYLAAAAEIGRLVTSTLDLNTIFSRTVNLVSERFGYYHAAMFVLEETGFHAILREATGEAGAEMKRRKHSLPVDENSIVGRTALTAQPLVVNNTGLDPTHKVNALLPATRAEAAIPLRVGTRVIGALDIQSSRIDSFTTDDMAVLQILADQVAIAIDNARSFELSQQAVKEMREVDRLKSQFLANISHELRTPLNSIIGFSRVILKGIDGPIGELQQQDLTAIYNSGQHLLGLINDILDLSKIEAGKMELAFDEVNVTDLINGVMSTAVGLVKDRPVKLVKQLQDNLPTVRADAIRVRQVLLNLLSNAAKFTEEGSITVSANTASGPNGRPEILISVTDTGAGIDPKDQPKLFQPFSQVDDSSTRKTGGTGLGLSISQQLIQMHGGRIGVTSTPGQGSTFYFALPVYRGKDEALDTQNAKVILAVDDDPQVISLYERYLQPQGYQVVAVTDPTRAIERIKQLKPYAITLDIMMPGYDGWSLLADLKADHETRHIPVIICSIIEDQERGFSLGAADYLLKPILEEDLLSALDHLNGDGSIREVLVIDDDVNALRLMEKILKQQGRYQPVLAEGGQNGWDYVSTHQPHAVILDLFMPGLDGFTILERMREDSKLRDIPVIIVSGGELNADQQKQLTEFGQRMWRKGSLNEEDLLKILDRALQRVETKK